MSTLTTFTFAGGPVGAGGGGGCAGCGGVTGPLGCRKGAFPAPAPNWAPAEGVIAGERVGTKAGGAACMKSATVCTTMHLPMILSIS